jgi:hypothetical protein
MPVVGKSDHRQLVYWHPVGRRRSSDTRGAAPLNGVIVGNGISAVGH